MRVGTAIVEWDLEAEWIFMLAGPQGIHCPSRARARSFIRGEDLAHFIEDLVVLGDGDRTVTSLVSGPVRIHRTHQLGLRLAFQLDEYGGDVLIAVEGEDDPAADIVEIGVEGVGVVELDSSGHDGRSVSRSPRAERLQRRWFIDIPFEAGGEVGDGGSFLLRFPRLV